MATYSSRASGQFGQGSQNPQFNNQYNVTSAPSGKTSQNPWVKELQSVLGAFGLDPQKLLGMYSRSSSSTPNRSSNYIDPLAYGYIQGGTAPVNFDYNASVIDPTAAIRAALPGIYEQQTIGFGNAAQRAGQSGMAMSTPYSEALGGVARKSTNDIASLTENMVYQANEAAAQRSLQAAIAKAQVEAENRNRLFNAAGLTQNAFETSWQYDKDPSEGFASLASGLLGQVGNLYSGIRESDESRAMQRYMAEEPWKETGDTANVEALMNAYRGNEANLPSWQEQEIRNRNFRDATGAGTDGKTALTAWDDYAKGGNPYRPGSPEYAQWNTQNRQAQNLAEQEYLTAMEEAKRRRNIGKPGYDEFGNLMAGWDENGNNIAEMRSEFEKYYNDYAKYGTGLVTPSNWDNILAAWNANKQNYNSFRKFLADITNGVVKIGPPPPAPSNSFTRIPGYGG